MTFNNNSALLQQSNRVGTQFLLTEADIGLTFLEVADTAFLENRDRNLNDARRIYATLLRLLPRVDPTPEERRILVRKMATLKDGLAQAGLVTDSEPFAAP